MRLRGVRGSGNVEDRRGSRGGMRRAGGLGLGGLLIVLLIGVFTGVDVTPLLNRSAVPTQQVATGPLTPEEQHAGEFAARVLATTEEVWTDVFAQELGRRYEPPVMVLYSGITPSPCGNASGATGPFFCPRDEKVYLDTEFFATLEREMGARGDFAAAYVVAHEVAHNVQHELGILDQAQQLQARYGGGAEANAISVRIELQADCLSGVWASRVEGLLDPGDIDEALNAAQRIGDDYLQRRAGRVPNPHSYTHGTSEQRARWFAQGYQSGRIDACDTFSASRL